MTDSHIVHGNSPLQVAFEYASHNRLPIGSQVEVTNASGDPVNFTVTRSNLSENMENGGQVKLMRTPQHRLTGGGQEQEEALLSDYVIHAESPEQAAMLFANESGVASNTHLLVTQDGYSQYFKTPGY